MKKANIRFIDRQLRKAERRANKKTGLVETYELKWGVEHRVMRPKVKNPIKLGVDDVLSLMAGGYDDIAYRARNYGSYLYVSKRTHDKLERELHKLVVECEQTITQKAKVTPYAPSKQEGEAVQYDETVQSDISAEKESDLDKNL